jgi:GST-like protein
MKWVATIAARPGVVKALAATDDIRARTTAFDKAAPEVLDKVFGRGQFAAA